MFLWHAIRYLMWWENAFVCAFGFQCDQCDHNVIVIHYEQMHLLFALGIEILNWKYGVLRMSQPMNEWIE